MQDPMKNVKLSGYGISPGLGMGTAYGYHDVLGRVESVYPLRTDKEVEEECRRIDITIVKVVAKLEQIEENVRHMLDESFARIFHVHREMLQYPSLGEEIRTTIQSTRMNAESVVSGIFRRLEGKFRQLNDPLMAERADDVRDLAGRFLRMLAGQATHELEALSAHTVIIAHRLLPSDTVHLTRQYVSAVVVEHGGPASHAAILARELGIPAVSRIKNAMRRIPPGRTLLVDGTEGTVVLEPDDAVAKQFRHRHAELITRDAWVRKEAGRSVRTRDGTKVAVLANISRREDAELANAYGADGVGLYRIEPLYFGRENLPDEEELLDVVQETLAPFDATVPITLRLLDIGGDKLLPFLDNPTESTPLLGRRGVRFLLEFSDLLLTQIRCFIRLARYRKVRILVPMVTLPSDMQAVREVYERAAGDLSCARPPALGSMIETPAAALCADSIAEVSDFLSAGTNDLTQYTMAASRENAYVENYFIQDHPAVFRLLDRMVRAAGDKPCGVCGELAGEVDALPELLGIGIREFSANPLQIPHIKQAVQEVELEQNPLAVGDGLFQ